MNHRIPICSILALAVSGTAAPATVTAQEAVFLEEIVVTARKRSESLLEVPESVASFSAGMLERANLMTLKDISLMVPNLYMNTRLDGFPNVSIRGLGGFGNTQGVGFYLDDVQLFSDATSRFGDMQRVEVLKGPQGVLYGGSNIGGAIKFVSERPDTEELRGQVKISAGEYGYLDGEAQVNVPLSDDWAMRLFAFSESSDGYLKNNNPPRANGLRGNNNRDIGEFDRFGVRVTLSGNVTERLSAFATLRYNELDAPNNTWIRELDGNNLTYSDVVNTSFNPRHERETAAASLELNYDFDGVVATVIGSYTGTDSDRESDLDLVPDYVLDLFRPEEFDATTLEVRVSSDTSAPLQWQAGAYMLDLERDLSGVLNIREGFCFLDPGFCDPLPGPDDGAILAVVPFELSKRKREQRAIFANLTYRVGNWELSGGLRVDRWQSDRSNLDSGLSGKQKDTEVLGRGSLAWFSDDEKTMLYATVSQGFEPGDLNLANFAESNELFGYDAESAIQYEFGYKGRLAGGRMSISTALFYIDYSDRQFELQATDPSGGFVEGIVNVGDSEQWGFEADLQIALAESWTGSLGLGYVDAEWTDGVVSTISGADLSGETPPNTADWSATAALDYSRNLDNGMLFSARAQIRHKSDASTNAQFFDVAGDDFPLWDNPGFTVVDLGGSLSWDAWELRVHIENILDEEYYIDAQEFPNFAGGSTAPFYGSIIIGTLEQPRRAVASIKYRF